MKRQRNPLSQKKLIEDVFEIYFDAARKPFGYSKFMLTDQVNSEFPHHQYLKIYSWCDQLPPKYNLSHPAHMLTAPTSDVFGELQDLHQEKMQFWYNTYDKFAVSKNDTEETCIYGKIAHFVTYCIRS